MSDPNVVGIYRNCCATFETYFFPSVLTVSSADELRKIISHANSPFDPKKVLLDLQKVNIVSKNDPDFRLTCKFCYNLCIDHEGSKITFDCNHIFCKTCATNLLNHSELCKHRECFDCKKPAFKK